MPCSYRSLATALLLLATLSLAKPAAADFSISINTFGYNGGYYSNGYHGHYKKYKRYNYSHRHRLTKNYRYFRNPRILFYPGNPYRYYGYPGYYRWSYQPRYYRWR